MIGKVDKDGPLETANPLSDAVKLATVTPSVDIIWEMIGKVDKDRALNDLRQLTGDTPICTSQGCYTIVNRQTGSEEDSNGPKIIFTKCSQAWVTP